MSGRRRDAGGRDPLGDDVGRVRAVLAIGGVPLGDVEDGVQQVRLRLLEHRSDPTRQALRDPHTWAAVVASRIAVDWHRTRRRDERLRDRLVERWSRAPGSSEDSGGSEGYHEYYLSCASTIVEGDILSSRPAARPGHIVLTLRVRDWLVPSTGPRRTEIEVPVPGPDGAPPARTGQRQLLFVWRDVDRVDRLSGGGVDSDIRKQAWRELLPRAREFSRSQCAEAGAR